VEFEAGALGGIGAGVALNEDGAFSSATKYLYVNIEMT